MKRIWLLVILLCAESIDSLSPVKSEGLTPAPRREVAFTIDDLPIVADDLPGGAKGIERIEAMTKKLLLALSSNQVPAIGFVNESRIYVRGETDARINVLRMWLDAGMKLGNHTFSHADFNTTPLPQYEDEVIHGEVITRRLIEERGQGKLYFRFPFNHTGPTREAKNAFEDFLKSRNYLIAPFTVEHEDYVFNRVYARAKRQRDASLVARVREAYLDFLDTMFEYFERHSRDTLGYEVKQVFLIHANEINADCMNEMIARLKRRGYSFITLDQALEDKAYRIKDDYVGRNGISWLHRWTVSLGLKMNNSDEPDAPKFIMDLYQAK
jgi:peptidoglycan/xylan/chitin deacetylase (PgdA/CDA1 family)